MAARFVYCSHTTKEPRGVCAYAVTARGHLGNHLFGNRAANRSHNVPTRTMCSFPYVTAANRTYEPSDNGNTCSFCAAGHTSHAMTINAPPASHHQRRLHRFTHPA